MAFAHFSSLGNISSAAQPQKLHVKIGLASKEVLLLVTSFRTLKRLC